MTEVEPEDIKSPPELDDELNFGRTILQFFVIPAFVVAVCVSVFFFFAWLVSDEKTGVDYLNEVRVGSANRRWQAAFELSKIITMGSEQERMQGLVSEMVVLFEDAATDDERIRHYLALSLGHLGDKEATPALISALSDNDSATRLYSSWALGKIGDKTAVGALIPLLQDDDVGVRKMVAYALGEIGDVNTIQHLEVALSDPERDVSWNAAISLAQLGSRAGEMQLLQMLDADFLSTVAQMEGSQQLLATQSAIQAAALLGGEVLEGQLRKLADSHPNLAIREVALSSLDSMK